MKIIPSQLKTRTLWNFQLTNHKLLSTGSNCFGYFSSYYFLWYNMKQKAVQKKEIVVCLQKWWTNSTFLLIMQTFSAVLCSEFMAWQELISHPLDLPLGMSLPAVTKLASTKPIAPSRISRIVVSAWHQGPARVCLHFRQFLYPNCTVVYNIFAQLLHCMALHGSSSVDWWPLTDL